MAMCFIAKGAASVSGWSSVSRLGAWPARKRPRRPYRCQVRELTPMRDGIFDSIDFYGIKDYKRMELCIYIYICIRIYIYINIHIYIYV